MVFAVAALFGFGSAGSSIVGAGGTMSLRKAITWAPLMVSVVPSNVLPV
jgi:hypothetical protein